MKRSTHVLTYSINRFGNAKRDFIIVLVVRLVNGLVRERERLVHIKHRLCILLMENHDYIQLHTIHQLNDIYSRQISPRKQKNSIIDCHNECRFDFDHRISCGSFLSFFFHSILGLYHHHHHHPELTAYWESEATAQTSYDVLIISSNWCIILPYKSFLRLRTEPLKMQIQITNGISSVAINIRMLAKTRTD